MNATELYISNTLIEVDDDVSFALNYTVADIRNPDKRNTSFSKTVVLPGTPTINQLFTHIYQIGESGGFNPNNKADVLMISAGAEQFKGYVQLKNIQRLYEGKVNYEVVLFGELGNMFASMGESYISDLDLSLLAHIRTVATISGSWVNTTGYVYPLVNNGQVDVQNYLVPTWKANEMTPCIFVKNIWDKIFSTYGFTYDSTWISGSPFTKLIIPCLGNNLKQRAFTVSGTATVVVNTTGTTTLLLEIIKTKIDGTLHTFSSAAYGPVNGNLSHDFTISDGVTYYADPGDSITFRLTTAVTGVPSLAQITVAQWGVTYVDESSPTYPIGSFSATVSGSQNISLNNYTTVACGVEISDPGNSYNNSTYTETVPGVDPAKWLPEMKQKDFFTSMIRMFNLYIDPDKQTSNALTIYPRDIYNQTTLIDWTDKVDLSQQWDQQPMPFLDFKVHTFDYKADEDFYNKFYTDAWNKIYGNEEIDVDTDFQTATASYAISFSPTPSIQSNANDLVLPTIVKGNPVELPINNQMVGNPRILFYGGLKTGSFTISNGATNYNYSSYPFASHVDDPLAPTLDLLFGKPEMIYWYMNADQYTTNNLYNAYYSKFIQEITNSESKLLTVYLYLTPHDIQLLSFRKQYFLLGHNFRLNKIYDFNPVNPQTTKVEFLKIIDGDTFVPGVHGRNKPIRAISHIGILRAGSVGGMVLQSPKDGILKLVNGNHWLVNGGKDVVYNVSGGTDAPQILASPKNSGG